ncbi:MAG: helix-turn-helix domain-containing protein [Prevotella sp.]|nr:helix-turn-helix domain-containing protein [Prevotella sp.]
METRQIEKRLCELDSFDEELISENGCPELSELMEELMKEAGMSRAELIRRLNTDVNYGYQLLNGTRVPTRERLIRIGLLLNADVDGLRHLLRAASKEDLYVRDITDAKVFYAIKHKMEYEKAALFIWGHSPDEYE